MFDTYEFRRRAGSLASSTEDEFDALLAMHLEALNEIDRLTPRWVNVYLVDRAYGGPEEGGWWYDTGLVELSLPAPEREAQLDGPPRRPAGLVPADRGVVERQWRRRLARRHRTPPGRRLPDGEAVLRMRPLLAIIADYYAWSNDRKLLFGREGVGEYVDADDFHASDDFAVELLDEVFGHLHRLAAIEGAATALVDGWHPYTFIDLAGKVNHGEVIQLLRLISEVGNTEAAKVLVECWAESEVEDGECETAADWAYHPFDMLVWTPTDREEPHT